MLPCWACSGAVCLLLKASILPGSNGVVWDTLAWWGLQMRKGSAGSTWYLRRK